jgi:hypothetical protein
MPRFLTLEVLVNSEGRVCTVRVLSADDPSHAQEFAAYIMTHCTFKPATRRGKPVAVKFPISFARERD